MHDIFWLTPKYIVGNFFRIVEGDMQVKSRSKPPSPPPTSDELRLIWGVAAIAMYIGRTDRQAYEALAKGQLPARRVNGRWVASASALRAHFEGPDYE